MRSVSTTSLCQARPTDPDGIHLSQINWASFANFRRESELLPFQNFVWLWITNENIGLSVCLGEAANDMLLVLAFRNRLSEMVFNFSKRLEAAIPSFTFDIIIEQNMTVYRTVELSEEQVARFEEFARENGFVVVEDLDPELPEEIKKEILDRAENWTSASAISKEQLFAAFKSWGWNGKS